MAINLLLSFQHALARLRPKSFAHEVSDLTAQAFHRLNRLGLSLENQVDDDIVHAVHDERRKALHDEASRRYIDLFDTLLALQALADKNNGRR
jgi:hypothetical protein